MKNQELITLGTTLLILGIVFAEEQLISYSFFAAGLLLVIASAFKQRRKCKIQSIRTGGV